MFDEFSKSELVSILEVIERARNCSGPEELKKIILDSRQLVSADYAVCGLGKISGLMVSDVLGLINGNFPEEWMNDYIARRNYFNDPIVKYHSQFSMTQFWTNIFKYYDDKASKRAIRDAADFGLKFGISSGIFIPEEEKISIFCFAGNQNRFDQHHKKIMDIITLHLNSALVRVTDITPKAVSDIELRLDNWGL
ncbi:MAG: autoinducer binding domain-containing protein [Deltaproteobacteria bacterium]|nr:autoinducer binding domain-containing protein [Deltaproteobacteria bacterium]